MSRLRHWDRHASNVHTGRFPSVGHMHPPALRLERTIRDIYGLEPEGLPDTRPLARSRPVGRATSRRQVRSRPKHRADPYDFLAAEGAPLHQIPVGPVHAGIIEPGHFRFSANGEVVVRLEERLGYVHKGIEQLMVDAPLDRAARLAGRVSGDSTVAYSLAFANAVESALEIEVPQRAIFLRALMAELERLANHIGDIGAICNDASFSLMHTHCAILRERILRAAKSCFGHRLMMDRITPGGVANDLTEEGEGAVRALLGEAKKLLPRFIELYGDTTSHTGSHGRNGLSAAELAKQYGCGGVIGRASGRAFDARRSAGLCALLGAFLQDRSRQRRRRRRTRLGSLRRDQSVTGLIEQILDRLPSGPLRLESLPLRQRSARRRRRSSKGFEATFSSG